MKAGGARVKTRTGVSAAETHVERRADALAGPASRDTPRDRDAESAGHAHERAPAGAFDISASVIEAHGLRAGPGARDVLQGVDIAIAAGAWTAVVGPNGAGKTTLVKSLALLLRSRGDIRWNGRDARAWSARERARQLAWLGQGETGADDLLAHDVVRLGRLPHIAWLAQPSTRDEAAVEAAMRETQCWDWRDRPLGELSGGERQRVLLARALAVQAPVLVMDEPLASLDPPHQSDWLAIVRRHVQRGGTAVSVLHELTMALHADAVVVVDAGCIAYHGPSASTACAQAIEHVFAHRVQVRSVDGRRVVLPAEDLAR